MTASVGKTSKNNLLKHFLFTLLLTALTYEVKGQASGNLGNYPFLEALFWLFLLLSLLLLSLMFIMWKPPQRREETAKKPVDPVQDMLNKISESEIQRLKDAGGKFIKNPQGEVEAFISVMRFGKDQSKPSDK